jgi:hypothetical protein
MFKSPCTFFLFKKKMFKSPFIQSNHRVQRKNLVDTDGQPVFAPDCSALFRAAKYILTPMSILCILDFYGLGHIVPVSVFSNILTMKCWKWVWSSQIIFSIFLT